MMTKEHFQSFWTSRYPGTLPIPHSFRHDFADRWFRIHSLPKSKRYADNDKEWEILLTRQNTIITDILGDNSKILIVTGEYHHDENKELHPIAEVNSIKDLQLTNLDEIDLYKVSPEEYDHGQVYRPLFCEGIWQKNKYDKVLRDVANDEIRIFFVSVDNDILVGPYDGGVDFILKDSQTRDNYKTKYRDWLSSREDGL
jgi:hypothetical protein